jgi:hypothetical protein
VKDHVCFCGVGRLVYIHVVGTMISTGERQARSHSLLSVRRSEEYKRFLVRNMLWH